MAAPLRRWFTASGLLLALMLALFLALGALTPVAQAQGFPTLTGRVVDAANLLDPAQEQALTVKLAALDQQSGRQLVVATIPDLGGQDISDYSYQLGRSWGIGQKGKDDGTLLVVAPNERKVWIATGYGVEGVITDALASRIYRTAIIPHFKANDYPGGIAAGVDAIATLLTLPPDQARAQAVAAEKEQKQTHESGGSAVMAIVWLVIIFFFIVPALFRRLGGRRYGGRSGMPIILWGPGLGSGSGWGDNTGASSGSNSGWGGFGGGDGGGFSGGGGSFGGGGAGGSW